MLIKLKQRYCKHVFRGPDLQPIDANGNVTWPCSKCGKTYTAPYGLVMAKWGKITGPWCLAHRVNKLKYEKIHKDAVISSCGQYRYLLVRSWDSELPAVCFIGLNPSTADAENDDPTIRRCIGYAKSWGYGTLLMVNLFAYRATEPEHMKAASYPVGGDNDFYLTMAVDDADIAIAAWGNDGEFNGLGDVVKQEHDLHYLKLNKSGQPAHPLYLKKDLKPIPFNA